MGEVKALPEGLFAFELLALRRTGFGPSDTRCTVGSAEADRNDNFDPFPVHLDDYPLAFGRLAGRRVGPSYGGISPARSVSIQRVCTPKTPARGECGVVEHRPMKRRDGGHSVDDKLAERPAGARWPANDRRR